MTLSLFEPADLGNQIPPFTRQLLKWVGNKQKFAHEIISYFPERFNAYHEPFLGSGAVLGTLAPKKAYASDIFPPLMEIWQKLSQTPETLIAWYTERWEATANGDKQTEYERIRTSYNANPNGADLLFLCRVCYGGIVRFRQADGYMSTPCGVHKPMPPDKFAARVREWHRRTIHTAFATMDFEEALSRTQPGDMVYCDPPYTFTQSILYGAQTFSLDRLFRAVEHCKRRGVHVALSIDGTKRSGNHICDVPIPDGLFVREWLVNCGRSMLKRFQMEGQTLEGELVADRLLLTYS
jgi:DNA adenine methylase